MNKDKIASEKETKSNWLKLAKNMGRDIELRRIFDKYDILVRNCTNEAESKQIKIMALVEIHKLFEFRDALIVDGVEILPADPTFKID